MTLQTSEPGDPLHLTPAETVHLFAVGLTIPEPDRTAWVTVAELDVDDSVRFSVGTARVDIEFALQALRRGIEWALRQAVTHAREHQGQAEEQETHEPPTQA